MKKIITHVTPASLDPWPWIHSIEDFALGKVQPVRVDPLISDIHDILSVDANGCIADILVVCGNVILYSSVVIFQPA